MSATAYNQKTIDEFHAKNGLGVGMFGNLLLLMTAVGARSGEPITTPLVHRRDGDHYIVIASKGGRRAIRIGLKTCVQIRKSRLRSRRTVARRSSKLGLAPSPTDLNTTACTPSKRRSGRDLWITKSEPVV